MFTPELNFDGSSLFWLWMLCAALAVATVAALYRFERRLVAVRIGNTLLILRIAAVSLLFFTLLQPVFSWTLEQKRSGRILVAVDVSDSMRTLDEHASDGEKLRWARGLEMIGNAAIDDRLDRWQAALDAGEQPPWTDSGETNDPQQRESLARTRRENLAGIFHEISRLTRLEMAVRLLTETSSPLLQELAELGNLELSVFAGETASMGPEELSKLLQAAPISLRPGSTDLSEALSQTSSSSAQLPVLGIVLLTDGRNNTPRDPTSAARRLGRNSVPVYPIVFGSNLQPHDIAITALDFPETVFQDDRPKLKITLQTAGFEGRTLDVVLQREDAEPITKTIVVDNDVTELEFELVADKIGRNTYTVKTPVQPGETRDDNNSLEFAMTVVDDKAHVLLLDDQARWEFRFIDNAFRRDAHIEVKEVVFRQPYLGLLAETFFPGKLNLPADAHHLDASPFAEPDMVIIGDVSPRYLQNAAWELLEKFVAEAGGTLVLLAGKNHFPLSYNSAILDRLLPLTDFRVANVRDSSGKGPPTKRGFHLRLTPDGEHEPLLQFASDVEANRKLWATLPGHLWAIIGNAKPGAIVLASMHRKNKGNVLQAERSAPLIVRQQYGFGQVVWIGIDSTWRWRHRAGDKFHHRFWGQLVRWATSSRASSGNEFVRFGPDRTDIEAGQDVVFRARWSQLFLQRFPQLKSEVQVFRLSENDQSKPFTTLALQPTTGRPLMHEGAVFSLPPGDYLAKLVVSGADVGPQEITAPLYVEEFKTVELSEVNANPGLLRQIAKAGNGRLFQPDEVSRIAALFQPRNIPEHVREETTLWDHWLVLLLFCLLVTAEWIVRRLNGLP